MRLGFKIAKRFLKSNLGQTILIIMGIAIGVSVQIFIGILIQGLQKSLVDKDLWRPYQFDPKYQHHHRRDGLLQSRRQATTRG